MLVISQKKFIKPPQLVDLKYDLEKYISHLNNNDEINYIKFKARNAKYNEEYTKNDWLQIDTNNI